MNADAGVIQFSIPAKLLKTQVGSTAAGKVPSLATPHTGMTMYDGTVFTLANMFTPVQADQSYLYQVDQTASMDYVVGKGPKAVPGRAFR